MKYTARFISSPLLITVILVIINSTSGTIEDIDRELVTPNFPYGRGVDSELQLAKILYLLPQRGIMCHPKRNSEIINSLLGLPWNLNNAGK